MNPLFLSCDWGTSSFRLRLVDAATLKPIAETRSDEGVTKVFAAWQQANDGDRVAFYKAVLQKHISKLEQASNTSLKGMTLVISGMASSTIGMKELPYKPMPFSIHAMDLFIEKMEGNESFRHDVILISGVRTETDVMRGEETQLLGCVIKAEEEKQTFIFPGTHSKQVVVEQGSATHFKTYMTGEFFHLLSVNSILSNSVAANNSLHEKQNETAFVQGVSDSRHQELLHYSFNVRTNDLFNRFSKEQNYWYLSGLLIGTELHSLQEQAGPVTIVGEGTILSVYTKAFRTLYADRGLQTLNVDEALVKGHAFVFRHVRAS